MLFRTLFLFKSIPSHESYLYQYQIQRFSSIYGNPKHIIHSWLWTEPKHCKKLRWSEFHKSTPNQRMHNFLVYYSTAPASQQRHHLTGSPPKQIGNTSMSATRKRTTKKHYHGSSASHEVGVCVDHFKHVCGELIHVGEGSNAEGHDTALAGECSHVAVNTNIDVLTYHQRSLGIWRVLLQKNTITCSIYHCYPRAVLIHNS